MAVLSELPRRRMTPSIAAERAEKARLFEHKDVRVRAGARSARSAGKSSQPDVGSTVMPARWFWRLLPKQKSPARGSERNPEQSCENQDGFRLSPE